MIFETIDKTGHEEVVFCHNKDAGLKAIIAIHNTVLGPSLGGLRMWPYKSEQEAINDVLRLSRGMTYKNAVAGRGHVPELRRTSRHLDHDHPSAIHRRHFRLESAFS